MDAVPFMITVISRTSARVLFQNGPSNAFHGHRSNDPDDDRVMMAAGHAIIDRIFSAEDQNESMLQEIRQRLDSGRSWKRVIRVSNAASHHHRRPRSSSSRDPNDPALELVGPVPQRTLFMLHTFQAHIPVGAIGRTRASRTHNDVRSSMLMTTTMDCGIDLASHEESSGSSSDCGAADVWHDVTVQPYLDPATKDPAMMITQSEATTRVITEGALSRLNEVHLGMLVDVFPRHVIEFLGTHGTDAVPAAIATLAHQHRDVSILFMDVVGFTPAANEADPQDVMRMLNELFSGFDGLCAKHRVYKVETVGDCYVVASGLMTEDADGFVTFCPNHDPADSAARIVEFAVSALAHSRGVLLPRSHTPVTVRIGIHTGPCVTGLIGSKMPKFSIFGDTMNTASRMESTCDPGRIQVSSSAWELVKHLHTWQPTGGIVVKGKGMMHTYLLVTPGDGDDGCDDGCDGGSDDTHALSPRLMTARAGSLSGNLASLGQ